MVFLERLAAEVLARHAVSVTTPIVPASFALAAAAAVALAAVYAATRRIEAAEAWS